MERTGCCCAAYLELRELLDDAVDGQALVAVLVAALATTRQIVRAVTVFTSS